MSSTSSRAPFFASRVLLPALRASVAVTTPLVVGSLAGLPAVAQWSTIGALNASIVDPGGPYRERAIAVGLAVPLLGLAVAAGTLAGAEPLIAIPLAALVAALGGLGRAFGEAGGSAGLVVTFAYLVGLGYPAPADAAMTRALAYSGGAAFALLLSLAPGSIRPLGPLYRAVALVFAAAARLASAAGRPRDRAEETIRERAGAVRRAIESARAALGRNRAADDGSNSASERLYVLLRSGSRLSASLAALGSAIESALAHREFASVREAVEGGVEAFVRAARDVAGVIDAGGGTVDLDALDASIRAASNAVDAARDAAPFPGARYQAILDCRGVVRALETAKGHLAMASDVASRLASVAPGRPAAGASPAAAIVAAVRGAASRWRSQVALGSVLFRHALRVGLAVGASLALVLLVGMPRGYWTAISVMVILQPDFGGTRRRAIERSLGTLAGSVAAPLLAAGLPGPLAHFAAISALAFLFFTARGRQFVASSAAITTMILLLIDLATPVAALAAVERLGNTLLGALVALAAGLRLWPVSEADRFPSHVAGAVRANRTFLAEVARGDASAASSARRRAEVEAGNAEASYQRLLGEPESRRGGDPLPRYALVTANERLRRAITALEQHLGAAMEAALPRFEEFVEQALEALDGIAASLLERRAPVALPPLEATLAAIREHVARLKDARIAEIREGKAGETATKRAVLDTAYVERELDRLAREVVDLHAVATVLFGVRSSDAWR